MSDASEITALIHRYASLVDAGDVDGVSALFADATWRSDRSDAVRRGSDEVRPIYEQLAATGPVGARHLITDLTVTVDPGAATASARCRWTVLAPGVGHPAPDSLSGSYVDRFAKADGAWRFAERLITTDGGAQATAHRVLG